MSAVDVVLQVFRSVEERNPQLAAEVYHDDLEFHWPRPLPYAGSSYGVAASLQRSPGWAETWDPFQGPADRGLDARVVAASDDEVVVLWHQRGRDRVGRRIDTPVLGLYQVRDGKLARAQMFYFDPLAAAEFLAAAPSGRNA
jgi:ketosteroid isomerase-like protein